MLRHRAHFIVLVVAIMTSVMLFGGSAAGQSPANRTDSLQKPSVAQGPQLSKGEVASPEPRPGTAENKTVVEGTTDLKTEVEALKAENAAVRDLLQKMSEQQKVLLDQVDRLQRRLDGATTGNLQPAEGLQVANDKAPLTN